MTVTVTPRAQEAFLQSLSRRLVEEADLGQVIADGCSRMTAILNLEAWCFGCVPAAGRAMELRYCCFEGDWDGNTDPRSRIVQMDGSSTSSALHFAMSEMQPVVIANLNKETRFDDQHLVPLRVASGIVAPIVYSGKAYGTIGLFGCQPQAYSREDVQFVQNVCELLSAAVAHQEVESQLSDVAKLYDTTINTMAVYLLVLDADGQILASNKQVAHMLGFDEEELCDRSMIASLLPPESVTTFRETLIRLQDPATSVIEWQAKVMSRRGEERSVAWTIGKLPGRDERSFTLVATGIDTTDHEQAMRNLSQVEREVAAVRDTADELSAQAKITRSVRTERRASPRRPYPYIQSIAPQLTPDAVPPEHAFFEVRCRDISPDGFSFVTFERPTFERLVVSFGSPPSQIMVAARVAHVNMMPDIDEGAMVVGCDYLGRVRTPTTDESLAEELDVQLGLQNL